MNTKLLLALQARNQRGEGGGLTCPFLKFKEKCPDFGKKYALARFSYGFNFSFKMLL